MMALAWFLLLAAPGPCDENTSSWQSIRHGDEEIRFRRDGRTLLLAVRNLGKQPAQVDIVWRELGFSGVARVFDITAGKDEGKVQAGFAKKLPAAACNAYRLQVE